MANLGSGLQWAETAVHHNYFIKDCFYISLMRSHRKTTTTMHMTRTLLWWTYSLEAQPSLVWKIIYFVQFLQICTSSEFERSQKMTWLDFISNLGGICGLCLGISFISVTELLYWFTIRLFRAVSDPALWFWKSIKQGFCWSGSSTHLLLNK